MEHEPSIDQGQFHDEPRSRWGRTRYGSKGLPALRTAAPIGILLAATIATIVVATGNAGPRPIIGGFAVASMSVWACVGLIWALIVDRNTLQGAFRDPDQSIESVWYDRAASGAFLDILLITGLGATVVAFSGLEVPTAVALAVVLFIAMGSFGLRYLVLQRRG